MSSRESTNMYTLKVSFNILCVVHCTGLKTLYFMLKIILVYIPFKKMVQNTVTNTNIIVVRQIKEILQVYKTDIHI